MRHPEYIATPFFCGCKFLPGELYLVDMALAGRQGWNFTFLTGSGVQNLWVSGVHNSCINVPPVNVMGIQIIWGRWEI